MTTKVDYISLGEFMVNPQTGILERVPDTTISPIKLPPSPEPFTTGSRRSSDRNSSSLLGLRSARVHGVSNYAELSGDELEVLDDSVDDETYKLPKQHSGGSSGSGSDGDDEVDNPLAPGTNNYFEFCFEVTSSKYIHDLFLLHVIYFLFSRRYHTDQAADKR